MKKNVQGKTSEFIILNQLETINASPQEILRKAFRSNLISEDVKLC